MTPREGPQDDSTIPIRDSGQGAPPPSGEVGDDLIGRVIGSYRVLGRLGEGGMGVVYRAEHVRLRKTVALKFLRRDILSDDDSRLRFVKEARAAAALDHSSICPVYDFADDRDLSFISMAYVDGPSLRDEIAAGALPLERAVLVAIQVAEGLEEAHRCGILHRDIKPSNILAAGKGRVRIVDFGLALVRDTTRITRSGMIVGTATYMSPEQAAGQEVDHRTDIWSLGVTLYEMATGRPPFVAERPDAVLHVLTHREPPPLRKLRPDAPPELAWIVGRCLAKDPEDRYEDCGALLRDLRNLWSKLVGHTRARPSWILKNRGRLLVGGTAGLALSAAIVLAVLFPPWRGTRDLFRGAVSLQVTSDEAWEGEPALSPDGSRIAYAKDVAGNRDIYVINALGGESRRLTTDPAQDGDPCWMPDGSAILFVSTRGSDPGIWKVDPQGGAPALVLPEAKDPAVSPDGARLACGRVDPDGFVRLAVAPLADPARIRRLSAAQDGAGNHRHPAWSPDGTSICYAAAENLWLVAVDVGGGRPLTDGGIADDHPAWTGGGRIYFSSYRGNRTSLWRVGAGGGRPQRLTLGSAGETHPSISVDGGRLAYATSSGDNDEDVVVLDRATGRTLGLEGEEHDDFQPSVSADGDLVAFVSNRQEGRNEIWLQAVRDGRPAGPPRRLTDQEGNACHPAVSPDGEWIAYYRIVGERRDLWIVPVGGGPPRRVTDDPANEWHPAWSPDGRRLAFTSDREGGRWAVWVVPVADGGTAGAWRRVSPADLSAYMPVWSPDGSRIAFLGHHEGHNYAYVTDAEGTGTPRRIAAIVDAKRLRWNRATGRLWISAPREEGPLEVLSVSPDSLTARELDPPLRLHPNQEDGLFDMSEDGRLVVYSYPKREGNIWLLELREGAF